MTSNTNRMGGSPLLGNRSLCTRPKDVLAPSALDDLSPKVWPRDLGSRFQTLRATITTETAVGSSAPAPLATARERTDPNGEVEILFFPAVRCFVGAGPLGPHPQ